MALKLVEAQVKKFLEDESPEVLAIKGRWGIGKTYSWKYLIDKYKDNCAFPKYSYVSLFGLNSINDIKNAIFLNCQDAYRIGQPPNVKTHALKIANLIKDTKIPYVSKKIGDAGSLINIISQISISNTIICFDDLERISQKVDIKDFMGLVSNLKEEKKCKIVILLNEDDSDKSFKYYRKNKEKIVDKQISFNPSAEESLTVIFDSDYQFYNYIEKYSILLNIKNIRIYNKIRNFINELDNVLGLKDYSGDIVDKIIKSSVLFNWLYYSQGSTKNDIPDLDYLVNNKFLHDEEKGLVYKIWYNFSVIYSFHLTDTLSYSVYQSVKDGYIDDKLKPLCDSLQDEINSKNSNLKLNEAWELFHYSLEDNKDTVVQKFVEGLKECITTVSMRNFDSTISLLRELGEVDQADKLIEYYIDTRKDCPELLNIDDINVCPFGISDSVLKTKIKEAYKIYSKSLSINEILENRRESSTYNQSEVDVIDELSYEDIKQLILTYKGEDLHQNIRVLKMLSNGSNSLKEKLNLALKEISDSNSLNKARLSSYIK